MPQDLSIPLTPSGDDLSGEPPRPRTPILSYEQAVEVMLKAVGVDTSSIVPGRFAEEDVQPEEGPPDKDGIVRSVLRGAKDVVTHPGQTLRSVGRGVVNGINATARTLIEVESSLRAKAFPSIQGIADKGKERSAAVDAFFDHANDAIFGPRSLKASQGFVEDTANFLAGFFGAGKIKAVGAIKSVVKRGLVKGAIADFATFDPYQAQFAELAAQTHVPGFRELGELLSVEGDDGPIAARAKRALGGAIPGGAIDGLIAIARLFRAKKVLQSPTASATEREAAADLASQQAKVLEDIQAGTHNNGDPVQVRPNANGQWDLFEQGSAEPLVTHQTRWEAEAQATSVNEALAARFAAKAPVSRETMEQAFALARQIEAAKDNPEEIMRLVRESRFNFSYMDPPEKVESLIKATGEVLSSAFDKAQGRPSVTWTESVERARVMAGMIPREEATEYLKAVSNSLKNSDAALGLMDSRMMELGEQVAKWAEVIEQRPSDLIAIEEARRAFQSWAQFSAEVAGANSGIARGLNFLKNRGDAKLKGLKFKGEEGAAAVVQGVSKEATPEIIAGMTASEVRAVTNLFRLSKEPKVLFNTMNAVLEPGNLAKSQQITGRMIETFYNFTLSHPAVHQAVFVANALTNAYEDAVRLLAGTATANKELVQEGADIIAARMIYGKQSLVGMVKAYRAGHSIIDPHPVVRFNNGVGGQIIRTLGSRPMAAMDEFWRTNSNLAYVRAKALRVARKDAAAQGLKGDAVDKYVSERVEAAVSASIDPKTGASRLPEARDYALLPTFSSPLRPNTFGADLNRMIKKHPFLIPIAPFVRTSVNIARYSFLKNSPLGLLSREIQESLARGGEEAAITATRMSVGTLMWGGAALMGLSGEVTGNGPSDPQLRKMWLKTHQPYSVQVGGKWISYRRVDPFSTLLSVMADLGHILRDHGNEPDVADQASRVYYGLIAAGVSGFTNKTYLHGLVDFMHAIGSRDANAIKKVVDLWTTLPIPSLVQVFNNDPYLRETKGMFDALRNKVPGWSEALPARYDWSGDPVTLEPSRSQRALFAFPTSNVKPPMAEDELLRLQKSLVAPPTIERYGKLTVNLHDRSYRNSKGSTLTPYERWMELVREQDLRGQVDKVMSNPAYDGLGDGIDAFPGGRRYAEIRDRYERVYARTRRQMLSEYPELKREVTGLSKAKRASARSDDRSQGILDRIGR